MTLPGFQAILNNLSEKYNQTYSTNGENKNNDFEIFQNLAEKYYKIANNNNNNNNNNTSITIDKLTEIIISNKDFIKVNHYQIPEGILPSNKIGYIDDINVIITPATQKKIKKQKNIKLLTDDYVYKNYPIIQKNIPRGLTICKILNNNNNNNNDDNNDEMAEKEKEEFHDICIYANKKFTGINDHDDDDNDNENENEEEEMKNKYFIQDVKNNVEKIIFMEKINGDAFHFSCRYLFDQFYWFVGSKRNHIMISKEKDIDLYTDERHTQAKKFAKSFMKMLNEIPKDQINILASLLHYTKVTAVCEVLQPCYQHIVYIDGDFNKIIFLAFSSTFNNDNSLAAFPPHIACNVMELLDITPANYKIIEKEKEKEIEKIRSKEDSEGMVLYYLNKNNETIGLLKLKTCWYILLRALREKLSYYFGNKNKIVQINIKNKIEERYNEIQKWLLLSNQQLEDWKNVAIQFTDWMILQKKYKQAEDIKSKFPIYWKEFISNEYYNS